MDNLVGYLALDRARALARGAALPDRTSGAALFADISGFTALTEALARDLGPRRGAEELTRHLNAVYTALIGELHQMGGVALGFSGDAITCWFDEATLRAEHAALSPEGAELAAEYEAPRRAVACALAMQAAMGAFAAVPLPNGGSIAIALKVAVATGPARRFVVGDPAIQLMDVLAGATLQRVATAERLSQRGEVIVDPATADVLGAALVIAERRTAEPAGPGYAVVAGMLGPAPHPLAADLPQLDAATLRPWMLPVVYERLRAGLGAFLTELRPAVALFLGFDGIDYDGDEQAGALLNVFISRAQAVLAEGAGTLLQVTIGDKGAYLYAALGIPVAHEDDTSRAARAALALLRLSDEIPELARLRIGLSQGQMCVGAYGSAARCTYGVLGDDVNVAARLMQLAAPGEALLSGRVQVGLGIGYELAARPPLAVKGKAEPLPIFELRGYARRPSIRLEEPVYSLPMIGRGHELGIVAERIQVAALGRGQIVALTAEAGMGKSRLVAEVLQLTRRRGWSGYGGACVSYGTRTPYLVWRPIIQALLAIDPALPPLRQIRLLEAEIARRAPARAQALPLLSPLLDLPLAENDFTRTLEPQDRKGALEALLVDCLRSAAAEARAAGGGLLLVFEDLHWIDALSHDLLEAVAREAAQLPMLLVLAYRPPETTRRQAPRVEAMAHCTRIALSELTAGELEELIGARLAQLFPARAGVFPADLARELSARAQGNPFFVEELLSYLRDRGVDPYTPAALAGIDLPTSLQRLILSRIDQLTEREQTTLRVASVIGRHFRAAWLPGSYPTLGDLSRIKGDLDELARLELTPLDTPEPELTYLFKHIMTQEVAYESLSLATRATLHEQLARWLEAGNLEAPPLDLLAYHYDRSENLAKRREYLLRAGDQAQATAANEAAIDYFRRLLPLLGAPAERVAVLLKLGTVLELIGRWDDAESNFRSALELGQQAGNNPGLAQALYALGALCNHRGDYPAALDWLGQAEAAWVQLGEQGALSRTLTARGATLFATGAYDEAHQTLTGSIALARAAEQRLELASALNALGGLLVEQGNHDLAIAQFNESLALRHALGDRRGAADTLLNLGLVNERHGDYGTARAHYEEALAFYRTLGDTKGVARALRQVGNVSERQGDYPAARQLYEESLSLQRMIGDRSGMAWILIDLGRLVEFQAEYETARTYYEESLALHRAIGEKSGVAWASFNLGVIEERQGAFELSKGRLREALALFQTLGATHGEAWALYSLGCIAREQGDFPAGRAQLEQAAAVFRSLDDQIGLACYLDSLGCVELMAGNVTEARVLIEQSLARFQALGERPNIAWANLDLGFVALHEGAYDAALRYYELGTRLSKQVGYTHLMIQGVCGGAGVMLRRGEHTLATRLGGAVTALWARYHAAPVRLSRLVIDEITLVAGAALGEAVFGAAWAAGAALGLDEAIMLAFATVYEPGAGAS